MAFGRVIETIIGPPGESGLKITGLRQSFLIEKTDRQGQNKCELTIYGIARSRLAFAAKGNVLQVSAGYLDEGIQPIFYGEIINSEGQEDKEQYSLRIEATDGQTTFSDRFLSLSYAPGTPRATAFQDVTKVLALPIEPAGFIPPGNFPNGYSFIGRAVVALSEILTAEGYEWSIQNRKLAIYKSGQAATSTGVLLSKDTGLLDAPQPLSGDSITGYKLRSLLHPQILPGASIRVESQVVTATLRVKAVLFDADSEEGDFVAITEAEIV